MKKDLRNVHLSGKDLDQDLRIKMPDDSSKEMLDTLFLTQDGLKLTDIKHGIHQRNTHLGSIEGMMGWIKRENEKN